MTIISLQMHEGQPRPVKIDAKHWIRIGSWALVRNPLRKCWHLAHYDTGVLCGAGKRKELNSLCKKLWGGLNPEQLKTAEALAQDATEMDEATFYNAIGVNYPEREPDAKDEQTT